MRAIVLREELGYSQKEIASIFGMHDKSVSRWFSQYRREGYEGLKRRKAPGATRVLSDAILGWLENVLEKPATEWGYDTPLWTASMLRGLLREQKGIYLHRTTVWRFLRRCGLTWKKPERRYIQQNQELVDKWLQSEWPNIQQWAKQNRAILYFEDESGISLAPVTGKTWAKK